MTGVGINPLAAQWHRQHAGSRMPQARHSRLSLTRWDDCATVSFPGRLPDGPVSCTLPSPPMLQIFTHQSLDFLFAGFHFCARLFAGQKETLLSHLLCWDRSVNFCGATRLDAIQRPLCAYHGGHEKTARTIIRRLLMSECLLRLAYSPNGFPLALRSPFPSSRPRRACTVRDSLYRAFEAVLTLPQRLSEL